MPDLKARTADIWRKKKSPPLAEYATGAFPSSGRRFENIVRFATVDCVKAGWPVKSKWRWSLTNSGGISWKTKTFRTSGYLDRMARSVERMKRHAICLSNL